MEQMKEKERLEKRLDKLVELMASYANTNVEAKNIEKKIVDLQKELERLTEKLNTLREEENKIYEEHSLEYNMSINDAVIDLHKKLYFYDEDIRFISDVLSKI